MGNVFSPDVVKTLRIDWKSEDREKFYLGRWGRCLDRSNKSLRNQNSQFVNFFDGGGPCEIQVVVFCNLLKTNLQVHNIELKKGDNIGDLDRKIKEKGRISGRMKVTLVKNHQITRIFEQPTEHLTKTMFLSQTIVAYPLPGLPGQDYFFVNLFDLGTRSFFGIPFLLEKPKESIDYKKLQKELDLELKMSRFLSEKSDRALGKKLDTWWSTQSIPKAVNVDVGRSEGVLFEVHKLVLKARSEAFEAMLSSSTTRESSKNELIIPDIQPRIVKKLIQLIYSDNCDHIEMDDALELFVAADKYMLDGLKSMTTSMICGKELPKLKHVLRLASFGSFYNSEMIVAHAIEQILISFPAVIKLPEWESTEGSHVDKFFFRNLSNFHF